MTPAVCPSGPGSVRILIPASCSEPSITCYFGFSLFSASSTVSSSPLQVLKRVIVSPIHVSSLVQPRHPRHPPSWLHQISFLKSLPESSIGQTSLSLSLPCRQVLKRGIVSAYPIHAFAFDLPSRSPKHFVRIVFCQPLHSSMSKIFILRIQLPYSSPPHRFFFSEPRPLICS
jgi:hypothetical protein